MYQKEGLSGWGLAGYNEYYEKCDHIKLSAYCGKFFIDIWLVTLFS